MKAMILAAGLGTRLKPFTDKHPKALALVNGKSVLQRNIEYLQQYGITEVIINVHHFAEQIIDTIEKTKGWGSQITISNETDALLETGGGIKKAAWFLNAESDCVVMNADILTDLDLTQLIAHHQQNQALATLATTDRTTSRYLLFNKSGLLNGWKNETSGEYKPTNLLTQFSAESLQPKAFSGIQILSKTIFRQISFSGKFSMIDVYLDLCSRFKILSFDHSHSKFVDIGTIEKITLAETLFI